MMAAYENDVKDWWEDFGDVPILLEALGIYVHVVFVQMFLRNFFFRVAESKKKAFY